MEHKLDDFFRKKIDDVEDNLPENSTFDEQLFWNALQKNLDKPKSKSWWKWVAVAACLGGVVFWIVSISTTTSEAPKTSYRPKVELPKEELSPVAVVAQKTKVKTHKLKKKKAIEPNKELKVEVEKLAAKANSLPAQTLSIKQDSIHFKVTQIDGPMLYFKTIHVNEISNTEKPPIPQPKFKIRFAARNQQ